MELLPVAIQHYQAGRLKEAEALFNRVIAQQPENSEAMYRLGTIAHQQGKLETAIYYYQQFLADKPDNAEVHNNLAIALVQQGRLAEALTHFQQALQLKPNYVQAHYNLALALKANGKLEEAIAHYRRTVELQPNHADAYNNLGNALLEWGKLEAAIASYQQAIKLVPTYAKAYSNLAIVLTKFGRIGEAIANCQRAIQLNPNCADAYYNMGNALQDRDSYREAIAWYQKFLQFQPNSGDAYNNIARSLIELGEIKRAIATYKKSLMLQPGNPGFHKNLGIALLLSGNLKSGFIEYEWRWRCPGFIQTKPSDRSPNLWDGSYLPNSTILLYAEQGLGDAIQFIRYVYLVRERVGRVIVECPQALLKLFRTIKDIDLLVEQGSKLPKFDTSALLMSLPRIFRTTLETIPDRVPYLETRELETAIQLPTSNPPDPVPNLKVGIVWKTNKTSPTYRQRSCQLTDFLPLLSIPGISFWSLQKDVSKSEREKAPSHLIVLDEQLQDFADTATIVEQLDLIITVDTAVAHLAGAMGKKVWVLLPFSCDWRWMLNCQESPWYPTMRLFRQPRSGDWSTVFIEVRTALNRLLTRNENVIR